MLGQSLGSFWERGEKPGIVSCLEGVAGLFSRAGQADRAVRLFGVAARVRDDMGIPLPASERLRHERYVAATRAQLDEEAWQLEWEQGQAMTLEQAVEHALRHSSEG